MSDERNRPNNLLLEVESIARLAGEAILEVYDSSDLSASLKPDQSPVTAADLVSEEVIRNGLMQLSVQYLIVSEESTSISFEERVAANRLWIVDPLDGTKEFLKRNDEFCVCIALIEKRRPILGVIHAPVSGKSYLAAKGEGVLVRSASGEFSQLSPKPRAPSIGTNDLRFGVSRSHLNQATKDYLSSEHVINCRNALRSHYCS